MYFLQVLLFLFRVQRRMIYKWNGQLFGFDGGDLFQTIKFIAIYPYLEEVNWMNCFINFFVEFWNCCKFAIDIKTHE